MKRTFRRTLLPAAAGLAVAAIGFSMFAAAQQPAQQIRTPRQTPFAVNPDFAKLAEAYGIKAATVRQRAEVVPVVREARGHDGPMLINFHVEQEDTVYPMVAAGSGLHEMIRRPSPIVETATDE